MTDTEVLQPHWKDVLLAQGRSLRWLSEQTGVTKWAVYRYSSGTLKPRRAWLDLVSKVLGMQVRG